jgi:pyruvate/2-oxoglutarate dehydrogenase complex dihydrolipoamide acyltransferase (E2) component
MPDLGVEYASISLWFVEVGEPVWEGERVVEVLTSGATFDVVAPATGRLAAKCVFPNERVENGQTLGTVDPTAHH